METISFNISIHADVKTVWNKMLEDKTYRIWTKEFHEGSYYEGTWEKGTEIRFVGPDDDGNLQGMFSKVQENIPYQFISILHVGLIVNGVVDTESEAVKQWAPSVENYTFQEESKGNTKLTVEMQIAEEYKEMFQDMWSRALKALKTLCEG
ncbi:hypothetical protein EHQ76_10885 [Leptospira barantonii]|uniref:SRPBCC domain-containing protein n=1 Tax=Leptospira barantonii TaxID=2023184 RepID=A0A5F2B6B6_9LEPT|nr:hypothetical protein [Leptospira barantonii]TGM01131.1 hypothetical protein EHQ76_10885 [Leptospira barantonii]